jgi:hypothetical protein
MRWTLMVFLIACSAHGEKHDDDRLTPLAGTRLVSNTLAAPQGASWRSVVVRTHLGLHTSGTLLPSRSWQLQTEVAVTYPDGETYAAIVTASTPDASAARLEKLARRRYELRLARGTLELREAGGKWASTFMPRRPHHAIDGDVFQAFLPDLHANWTRIHKAQINLPRDPDATVDTHHAAQWNLDHDSLAIIFFDCDSEPEKPEHAICTDLPDKLGKFPMRAAGATLFVRAGRIAVVIDSRGNLRSQRAHPRTPAELKAIAAQLDLEKLSQVDTRHDVPPDIFR